MNFCILRTKKLTSMGSIAGSAMHTFRELPTPNVDATRTHLNWAAGAKTSAEVCAAIKASLPSKRRKDAVLCIEYLITASPEWLRSKSEKERIEYFNGAIAWLRGRHGATNIVCMNWQRDETSEHLVVYTTALTRDGRLSAKDFLGGRAKLTAMQTDFWTQVGRPVGLQRGLEGSTAKHITAKQYSAAIAQNTKMLAPIRPQASIADRITGRAIEMEEAHAADHAEFVRTVERARSEALLMKKSRKGEAFELLKLRADRDELLVIRGKAKTLALENRKLQQKISQQVECFANQIGAMRLLLNQATARIAELLAAVVAQRKPIDTIPRGTLLPDSKSAGPGHSSQTT